ncbi:MAG: 7-cyano-7-deazaguanine synthase QueC [Candidatus Omnitrophica bacterium]|nr:7-cyano-7-deazaguanine synthase QueC [Candidatus Omnitrophota bacterium]
MKKAVCLYSGGMDSAVCLFAARADHYEPIALSIEYGQRHYRELSVARNLTKELGIRHYFATLSLPWKGSALLDESVRIPRHRETSKIPDEIPATYVPGRNSVFLSMGMSCAETQGAEAVFFGANALDYSGYPDCRPEYLEAFALAVTRGMKAGAEGRCIEIKTPLLRMTKKEIVLLGQKLEVPFAKTWSCYEGDVRPCGACDACLLRAKGFREAGLADPLSAAGPDALSG